MNTYLDCIPCFLRQTLDAARLVTDDEAVHERLLYAVLREVDGLDPCQPPPAMGQRIHRRIRALVGQPDPYAAAKARLNRLALGYLPELRRRVEESDAPLEMAARLAIAGNVIDMGVNAALTDAHIAQAIEGALQAPLRGSVDTLARGVADAQHILFLADNAGEVVFDRLLLERLPREKVTVVVRGAPVINDATLADARMAGLVDWVQVIDNGSDAPGTILDDCSAAFRRQFAEADLIIAKGQGNFETLSDVPKNILFMFMVKCPVIAREVDGEVGSLVLHRSGELARAKATGLATTAEPPPG